MKPIIVGESNPFGGDDHFALYPEPPECSGGRLCRLVMGLRRRTYMKEFERVNLVQGKWSMRAAREKAAELTKLSDEDKTRLERFEIGRDLEDLPELRTFILLGRRVAEAFGWKNGPQETKTVTASWRATSGSSMKIGFAQRYHFFIFLPHPSGRNRIWSDPEAIRFCRAALMAHFPRIPFGELENANEDAILSGH